MWLCQPHADRGEICFLIFFSKKSKNDLICMWLCQPHADRIKICFLIFFQKKIKKRMRMLSGGYATGSMYTFIFIHI